MDPKLFQDLLDQCADWHRETVKDLDGRGRARSKPTDNNTLPIVIDRIKTQPTICEDCGLICDHGRRVESRVYFTGSRHWRERCLTCNRFRNPESGCFDVMNGKVNYVYTKFARRKKRSDK